MEAAAAISGLKSRWKLGTLDTCYVQAAPTDWRQPAARSSGSAFQTKCLVYDMSTMHMRWRLASSTMLHVNPKVRGQHPRLLERRAGSPPLSSRWSSTNVEITDCQLGQLITGQLGFGGGVCHHRMPPRSGRETSARTVCAPKSPYPVRTRQEFGHLPLSIAHQRGSLETAGDGWRRLETAGDVWRRLETCETAGDGAVSVEP